MKTLRACIVSGTVALLLVASHAAAAESGGKAAAGAKGRTIKFITADQVQFKDAPNMQGISTAQLWGDMSKGGDWGALFKFKSGTDTGWHTHSGPIHLVMISGTLTIEPEGGPPTELKAGAYVDETAKVKHRTTCGAEDCVFFIHMKSKFDFKPVKEVAAGAAK